MTPINSYDTVAYASIVKGMLESYGIPAVIESDGLSTIYPTPMSTGNVVLLVPDDMAEEAKRLIDEHGDK